MDVVKNDIQVFGLPRSGTNFIEWSLKNNFKNIFYNNLYMDYKNKQISVKHYFPSFIYSDYVIIIYKEYNPWLISMKKDGKHPSEWPEYEQFLKVANSLPKDKTIIIEHTWAVENYFQLLDLISEKFNFELIDNPTQPKYRLNKLGAKASQTNLIFQI
tara:strand:+ start:397 stop:870 length:474 start_codon:yes stop_codon:yes gene_type:complete